MGRASKRKENRRRVPAARTPEHPRWPKRRVASLRRALVVVLPVLAIFFGARVALAEAYRIPSGSMEPTLQIGDWIW
jgi:signal peptidase I